MEWPKDPHDKMHFQGATQAVRTEDVHPPRKILAVVTVGRYTCAAPMIEVCRVLHSRGHEIQFAVLKGWEKLLAPHSFVSKVHVVGRDLTVAEDDELYRLLDASTVTSAAGRKSMAAGITFLMRWWPETYANVKQVCVAERPDFVFSDLLADASVDVARELDIPLAMSYPQMPIQMLPSPYIPGLPGMQLKHLTSEHASLWGRMMEEYSALRLTISMVPYILARLRQRAAAGLRLTGRPPAKPDYLVFVNSFFGLEVAKDLPPTVRAIGPVLSDEYPALDPEGLLASFLASHRHVLYVSFGSHMVTPDWRKHRMIEGMQHAMKEGHIDGVIWAMKPVDRPGSGGTDRKKDVEANSVLDGMHAGDLHNILAGQNPDWLMVKWIPQRAILSHPSTALYLSHCGGSSTMEAAFHGVPVLAMPIDGDQLGNGKRLAAAGVGVYLDKDAFSARGLARGIAAVARDADGSFARNVLRLRRVAHVNARGKEVAASLIEETIYDRELSSSSSSGDKGEGGSGGSGPRGPPPPPRAWHLQTCDTRMLWVRRTNWDLWLLFPVCLPLLAVYAWICKT